ncbi:hypothetical protein HMPREF0663_10486 [Hoylesella oralis ATCC 33269]|uniref:Uncharacterized protein n=1 Tax=Hoylesella oralis ATCC 33269 TaxID=873533 RepID=E7RMY6_9BACT|nr:hypothetical protein HMPREF0663_10486 [Hoylesella oralis ATCC 33269]
MRACKSNEWARWQLKIFGGMAVNGIFSCYFFAVHPNTFIFVTLKF